MVIITALETMRVIEMRGIHRARQLLEKRIEVARQKGDHELIKRLSQEHERWIILDRGAMLPSFLRAVPPIFSLKPANQAVRVVALGDFGIANQAQEQVAHSMFEYHRRKRFDFGLTVGDNFYGSRDGKYKRSSLGESVGESLQASTN